MRRQFPVDLAVVPRIPLADGAAIAEEPRPGSPAERRRPERVPGRAWRALAIASLGTVLVGFNSTATNIAIDAIKDGFPSASASAVGWGVAGYLIGTAAFLPLGGRLADRVGRKRIFQAGLVLFAVSAVLSAVAPTVWTLNLARVLQAVAGAAVLPASLSLVLPMFPTSRRTTAVMLWSSAGPLAAAIAPTVAAQVLELGGWRTVYFVSAPLAMMMFVLGHFVLDELPTPEVDQRLDVFGAFLGTVAVAAVVAAVMQGGTEWGPTSPTTFIVGAVGVIALVGFVANSVRHPQPLINLSLLRRPGVRVANLGNFLISITSLPIWLVWPLFLGNVWGYSVAGLGLAVTLGPVSAGMSTLVFSRIGDRVGAIPLARLGAAIQVLAVSWHFSRLDETGSFWLDFAPGISLYGIGWGMSTPMLNSLALSWVEEEYFGETNGLFNTLRYAAAAVGTALVFALLIDKGADQVEDYRRTFAVFAIATLIAFASVWLPVGERSTRSAPS